MDRSKLTPNQLGKLGEEMAAAELREQGIEVIKGHFAYRVEGVEGYGFTNVVGIKDNYIYSWEAKKKWREGKTHAFSKESIPFVEKGSNDPVFWSKCD